MSFRFTGTRGSWLIGASALVLAACGGGEPAGDDTAAAPPPDAAETADMAGDATTETAEETASEMADTAEDTAAEVAEAAEEAADEVEAAATDAAETVEEATDAATEAAAETVETVELGGDEYAAINAEQVPAEVIAQYEALTGDPRQGRRVFTVCMSCHVVQEGQNRVGPTLYGIIGRPAGTIEGFRYSDANANSGIIWTEATMFAYLENPQAYIPGTIMAYPGMPDPQQRADVIAYIKQESGQ